ncbi:MAG: hypothetical protein GY954_05855, partial [Alteromonas sp.]|nr:hypothetical protein [Alteromonas sp.]
MKFSNNYHRLGGTFYRQALPEPVVQPKLLLWNDVLAQELQITYSPENDCELLAQYFTGNKIFSTSQPLSQAYAGHQFAHFNPQLGDGRAHLLGELTDVNGQLRDVQLKGSGMTPFSRQGDGRCALSPALREYLMSEAMHALGVPTTRCLSVVATGELVFRDAALPGAIVTSVSASHLRVGTFQYFAARNDIDSLKKLTNFAIRRHFPQIANRQRKTTELTRAQVLTFFSAVTAQQVPLILAWLRVGFIHGVMNT